MSQSAGTFGFVPAWGVHHCSSLQASEGGFQLRLKRTSARHDRARRPLDRISEGVLGGRLQATHCGSAQACSRTNVHKDHGPWTMDQQRLQAQLYSHLPRATAI